VKKKEKTALLAVFFDFLPLFSAVVKRGGVSPPGLLLLLASRIKPHRSAGPRVSAGMFKKCGYCNWRFF